MDAAFYNHPILNSPYTCPGRHWELDKDGQPTQKILESRRRSEFITPIPKSRKRKDPGGAAEDAKPQQGDLVFDEGKNLSTQEQMYDPTAIINEIRRHVDAWRALPNPKDWRVTPETARLLRHWRTHRFAGIRPFFCQIEAVVDLSATPFFLRGSGYTEGSLFPWTVSDFSLMDAIECGIVKLPRVPVADNIPDGDMPKYHRLWEHIGPKMPKMAGARPPYWIPGVNRLGTYGRWAFLELRDPFIMRRDFAKHVRNKVSERSGSQGQERM
jgi:hypothetical protein